MNTLTKFTNWMRSKLHKGYGQPTLDEIVKFLDDNFAVPTYLHKGKSKFYKVKPMELHRLIDENFKYRCDKEINKQAFRKLNYSVENYKPFTKKSSYKIIQLVLKKDIKINE